MCNKYVSDTKFFLQILQKIKDLRLYRYVKRRYRLADIGITLEFDVFDMAAFTPTIMTEGASDVIIMSDFAGNSAKEPMVALQSFHANGQNIAARVLDSEYNVHFQASFKTNDKNVRAAEYAWIQNWFYDNFQMIPLFSPTQCYAWHGSVISSVNQYSVGKPDLLFVRAA